MATHANERQELLLRVAAHDMDALQRLIVMYDAALRRTVAGHLNAALRRHIDPEDVIQQAYVSACKAIAECKFDSDKGFYKWLETIALARLADAQRARLAQKRDMRRELHDSADRRESSARLADRLVADGSTPSRKLARSEAVAAMSSSLARLSDDQRAVVELRFYEHRSVKDIARHLNKTEPAIHMLTHRALKRLRELMTSISEFLSRG